MNVVDRPVHLLTVKNMAGWLGVSVSTVWRAVRDGRLPRPLYPAIRCPRWDPATVLAQLHRNALTGRMPMGVRPASA